MVQNYPDYYFEWFSTSWRRVTRGKGLIPGSFCLLVLIVTRLYIVSFFSQFMFGVPKPEEDSALQRMLGKR